MNQLPENPIDWFTLRFQQANEHPHIEEANAVNLATASVEGKPSNRIVLVKDFSDHGFVFYTNIGSKKGQQLHDNPYAAICYYWEPLGEQVRIEGTITIVSDDVADAYFNSRYLQSRIGAWASKQSQRLDSEKTLLDNIERCTERWTEDTVRRPPFWGGFRLIPETIEFWSRGDHRLHRRVQYLRDAHGDWQHHLLYP